MKEGAALKRKGPHAACDSWTRALARAGCSDESWLLALVQVSWRCNSVPCHQVEAGLPEQRGSSSGSFAAPVTVQAVAPPLLGHITCATSHLGLLTVLQHAASPHGAATGGATGDSGNSSVTGNKSTTPPRTTSADPGVGPPGEPLSRTNHGRLKNIALHYCLDFQCKSDVTMSALLLQSPTNDKSMRAGHTNLSTSIVAVHN
jgi:hypothetical protein